MMFKPLDSIFSSEVIYETIANTYEIKSSPVLSIGIKTGEIQLQPNVAILNSDLKSSNFIILIGQLSL
jgi:hypothetical protein